MSLSLKFAVMRCSALNLLSLWLLCINVTLAATPYIGSFKVHPIEIRLGQVTKQYRLKNMETPSECDVS